MLDLLPSLDAARLARDFGAETVARAVSYAGSSVEALQILDVGRDQMEVEAQVWGTRRTPYDVGLLLTRDKAGLHIWSDCTCPVGDMCKHGAAVAMVLRRKMTPGSERRLVAVPTPASAGDRTPEWERQLGSLLVDLAGPPTRPQHKQVAVQVNIVLPTTTNRWGATEPRVQLRLLHEGARHNWIKTGINWAAVPLARSQQEHRPEQIRALAGLHAGLGTGRYYHSAVEEPSLDEFGPLLWEALRTARDAGVTLLAGTNVGAVTVLDETLDVVADVRTASDGTRLRLAVAHDGQLWSGARLVTVGLPAHGVAVLAGDPTAAHVVLARLSAPVEAGTVRLLRAGDPVIVPAGADPSWSQTWLPQLVRHLRVESSDGSVAIPERLHPRLLLTVEWHSATEAELRWEWAYGAGAHRRTCLVDSTDPLAGLREPSAEQAILDRLPLERPPTATEKVTGPAALAVATDLLPRLDGLDDVLTVVEVRRPDFREAAGDLDIRFETVPREATDGEPAPLDWLDLWVQIRIEGEEVPLAQVLEALTLQHEAIVLPSGLWIGTDRREFRALDELVRAAAELAERRSDRVRVGTHDLGLWAELAGLGIVDAQAAEGVRRAQALRDLDTLPRPEPTGVTSTLRGYQLEGFWWLAFLWETGLGGILADDMGLGKTLQVLALVSHAQRQGAGKFLVVAPTSVVTAWQTEAARHTPGLRVRAITASAVRRGGTVAEAAEEADLVLTSYTLLRLEAEQYAAVDWAGLVLDEAQQVKNHQGKTHQAVRRLEVPFKLAVTGTPFENRLIELWSLLSITTPGLYPWPQRFTDQVVRPVEREGDQEALRRFRQRIRPFLLRRTKELVAADLPPKQEQVLEVQLTPRHRRVYDTHLQRERQKILGLVEDFDRNRVAIFSALTRLRQLALDPGLVDPAEDHIGSAKLDLLVDHLAEITAEGHQALVFSQFTSFLGRVRHRLDVEGIATCYLDGRTRDRASVIADFRAGGAPVFLISLKAGGVGLTLTEADYVFVLDPWWNPATEAQAVDRAHRIGQTKPVLVYRLVSTDTIEEKVMELKARKAELFARVIDGEGLLSAAIGAEDVKALLD